MMLWNLKIKLKWEKNDELMLDWNFAFKWKKFISLLQGFITRQMAAHNLIK
jgi:hypothetical protein